MKHVPVLTFSFTVLALGLHASPAGTAFCQFDREALSRAELWRMWTAHFTHFGAEHLRWDVIAFAAFGALAELRSRRAFAACLLVAAFAVSLGVGVLQPQFTTYRGLSGLASALFCFVATDLLRGGWRDRELVPMLLGAGAGIGFVGKSVYELATGLTLFVAPDAAFTPVPLAHLIGAVVGVIYGGRLRGETLNVTADSNRRQPSLPLTAQPRSE